MSAAEHTHADFDHVPHLSSVASVWAIVTTLVVFGVVFKRAEALLLRRAPTLGAGLVQTMFQELTLLGALGLLLFTVEEAGALQGLSVATFGDTTTLPTLVRGVDMVLVGVVFAFLLTIVLLLRATRGISAKWHALETEARLAAALLVHYGRAVLDDKRRRSRCGVRLRITCQRWLPCAPRRLVDQLEEQVVYASLRARFLRPPPLLVEGEDGEAKTPMSALLTPAGRAAPVDLAEAGAPVYRQKNFVFAFQAKGPVKFFTLGDVTEGDAGDWVVTGEDGDVLIVSRAEFENNYVRVPGKQSSYRRRVEVYAKYMLHPYTANTSQGMRLGKPGTYLVQEVVPQGDASVCYQHWLGPQAFRNVYEPVDAAMARLMTGDPAADSLPSDFDFAMYLSRNLNYVMARILHIRWVAWATMHLAMSLLLAIHAVVPVSVFRVLGIASGYLIPTACYVILRKLRRIQVMLTARQAVERMRSGTHDDAVYNMLAHDLTSSGGTPEHGPSAGATFSGSNTGSSPGFTMNLSPTYQSLLSPNHHHGTLSPVRSWHGSNAVSVTSTSFVVGAGGSVVSHGRSHADGLRISVPVHGDALASGEGGAAAHTGASELPVRLPRVREAMLACASPDTTPTARPGLITTASMQQMPACDNRTSSGGAGAAGATEAAQSLAIAASGKDGDTESKSGATTAAPVFKLVPLPHEYTDSVRGMVESGRLDMFRRDHGVASALSARIGESMEAAREERRTGLERLRKAAQKVVMLNAFTRVQRALTRAPYETLRLRTKGSCACFARSQGWPGLCVPRNRHEQMFWFGRHGTAFIILALQSILMLMSFYVTLCVVLLGQEGGPCRPHEVASHGVGACLLLTAASAGPPALVMAMFPAIAATVTVVSHVELMKQRGLARSIVHTQYTRHGVRALRVLAAMVLSAELAGEGRTKLKRRPTAVVRQLTRAETKLANSAHSARSDKQVGHDVSAMATRLAEAYRSVSQSIKEGNPTHTHMAAGLLEEAYGPRTSGRYQRRRQEVLDVFHVFDRKCKGYIECLDIIAMLGTLHIRGVRPGAVENMLVQIDSNRNGRVEFEEFFRWIAYQDLHGTELTNDVLTKLMFRCVGTDVDDCISVYGLRHALCCLGMLSRYEDVAQLVSKYDATDTGTLNYAEFNRMISDIYRHSHLSF